MSFRSRTARSRVLGLGLAATLAVTLGACTTTATPTPEETVGPELPNRITIVVPYAAGGGTDLLGRHFAELLGDELGVSVIVENQPEGGQIPAMTRVSSAAPDGSVVLFQSLSLLTSAPAGSTDLTLADFTPISVINAEQIAFGVQASSEWQDMGALLDYAEANPADVVVGVTAPGSLYYVAPVILADEADVEFTLAPFDSAAPSLTALLGGHIDVSVTTVPEMLPFAESGDIRIIAQGSDQRLEVIPDVESWTDLGFSSPLPSAFRAIVGPAGMSDEVADLLEAAILKVVTSKEYLDFTAANNMTPLDMTRKETTSYLQIMEQQLTDIINNL